MYNGQKLEIDKEDADGIYDAKQLAIAHFKIPKSKQGLLAIEPAYNEEVTEDNETSDTFTYNRDGVPTEHEITEQDKYVMNVLEKLRGLYADLKANGVDLKSWGSSGNSMEMLYNDLLQELDRYVRYYLKVPGLDGGDADNSHPYLG
jgi:hypothetical protein